MAGCGPSRTPPTAPYFSLRYIPVVRRLPMLNCRAIGTTSQKMAALVPEDQHFLLSTSSPGPVQRRLALVVAISIAVVFILITAGVLSGVQTNRVDAFVPAYLSAMFVCDSITAILLYAHFSI